MTERERKKTRRVLSAMMGRREASLALSSNSSVSYIAGCALGVYHEIFLPAADEGPKRVIELKYIETTIVLREYSINHVNKDGSSPDAGILRVSCVARRPRRMRMRKTLCKSCGVCVAFRFRDINS